MDTKRWDNLKQIIVFDIDDTITNFEKTYLMYANLFDKTLRNTGRLHFDRWISRSYDWSEEERNFFRQKYRVLTQQNTSVKRNSVKLVNKLSKNYDIYFLSARNEKDFDMGLNDTKKWLKQKGFVFSDVIFNNNKAEVVKILGNVVAFVDDNIENCESIVNLNKNIKVYLVNTETNLTKSANFDRAKSFFELENILNEHLS